MAKDPAFLFYPGDYLRDTQMLSEKVQVAYDRIMCEHMRNICITQQQLKFLTKRLSPEELEGIMMILTKVRGGYQIEWVADSISKRKAYSESRRKNREGKTTNNISSTYEPHMENEDEDVNVSKNKIPTYVQFKEYALDNKPNVDLSDLKLKYEAWVENEWRDGYDKEIKNWKTKLLNTLPHLKEAATMAGPNQGEKFVPTEYSGNEMTYEEFKASKEGKG